jgi:hypothetical protein
MVHEIAGAAARERRCQVHKPVTIRECEVRAHASVRKFKQAHAHVGLAQACSRERLFVGDTTFEPIVCVFVVKSFAIFAALD